MKLVILCNNFIYKDLCTHKDINTYINGEVKICLKGVFAKNERGYRLNAIKKRF